MPTPDIVSNSIGLSVTAPAIMPDTTRHANDKLHYKFNCLKCFYFLLSKIIAGISNDKISMRI